MGLPSSMTTTWKGIEVPPALVMFPDENEQLKPFGLFEFISTSATFTIRTVEVPVPFRVSAEATGVGVTMTSSGRATAAVANRLASSTAAETTVLRRRTRALL